MFSWLSADTPGLDLGKDWEMPGRGLPWRCHCCEFMTYVTNVSCVENLLILGINNLADSVEELKGKESILFLLNDWTSFGYLENKHQWSQSLPVRTTQPKPFKEADDSVSTHLKGFSNSSVVKNLPASAGDAGLILGSWRSLEKEWQPTPVFSPGKSHGQRSLVGYRPWGHKRVGHDLVSKLQQHILKVFVF